MLFSGVALANGSGRAVATSGLVNSHGANAQQGNDAGSGGGGGGGGSLGRLQLKGVLDGLVKRSINEDK